MIRNLLAVGLLLWAAEAQDCDWDQSVDPDQGLGLSAVDARLLQPDRSLQPSDPESCRAACCGEPRCDLALLRYPADGQPQCMLVRCVLQDRDACVLQPSTQFKAYRKRGPTQAGDQEQGAGEELRLVPLMGAWEPKNKESSSVRCRLPMKVGSCRAAFPKFFYDVTNQSCRSFIYGGCEANANNFLSQEECEATCSGVTGSVLPDESTPAPELPAKAPRISLTSGPKVSQDAEGPVESEPAATELVPTEETEMSAADFAERCGAEPEVGPCRAAFRHWYYNSEAGSCQSFIYGGCKGNKNNYNSKESCIATCTAVRVLPSSKKAAPSDDDDDDVSAEFRAGCMAPSDPGPCRAAFPMFYYDSNTGSCQSFIYGGCRGNQNRYGSVVECMTHCSREGSFETHGKARDRWTAGVFLFVTLAVISALLLVTLVVITLRRHRLPRRSTSISDKEELLPDPDESSLESLAVPESPKPDKA